MTGIVFFSTLIFFFQTVILLGQRDMIDACSTANTRRCCQDDGQAAQQHLSPPPLSLLIRYCLSAVYPMTLADRRVRTGRTGISKRI